MEMATITTSAFMRRVEGMLGELVVMYSGVRWLIQRSSEVVAVVSGEMQVHDSNE